MTSGSRVPQQFYISSLAVETQPVPEPATVALMGIGIVGLVGAGYRKRKKMKQAEKY